MNERYNNNSIKLGHSSGTFSSDRNGQENFQWLPKAHKTMEIFLSCDQWCGGRMVLGRRRREGGAISETNIFLKMQEMQFHCPKIQNFFGGEWVCMPPYQLVICCHYSGIAKCYLATAVAKRPLFLSM